MKIALLGNFRAPYTSESDYKWTLESMGHTVFKLQETERTGEEVFDIASRCDAFMYIHTHGWKTPGLDLRIVFQELRKLSIPSFAYHLDLWLGIQRQKDILTSDYFHVDHFFTVDKEMADYMNKVEGMAEGHYLPAGVIERDCFLGTSRPKYPQEIIFTGSYEYHKEWPYRKRLLDFLHDSYGSKFKRYGHPAKDQRDAFYIMGADLNDLYASAKIVIGDTLCPNFTKPYYFSNRSFEVTGKGGFLIHPYVKGIEECFELGQEIVTYKYGDFRELKDKIDYYLYADQERIKIKLAGHERTKEFHTFTNRLDYMLETIL